VSRQHVAGPRCGSVAVPNSTRVHAHSLPTHEYGWLIQCRLTSGCHTVIMASIAVTCRSQEGMSTGLGQFMVDRLFAGLV
jgi:hypothetical protein